MAVDFVKSDGGKDKPKQSGYEIEYTNPHTETPSQPIKPVKEKQGNLLGFFHKAAPSPVQATPPAPVRAINESPQQPKPAA